MILRHDDPLVKPLQELGEPIFVVDSSTNVEPGTHLPRPVTL